MVNRSSFRNLHFNNLKLITWLQIFIIAIAPNFIFYQEAKATTVAGEGWSVTKRLVQGATTFYDGAKNVVINGKNYAAKGTAAITPSAAQASKMIVRVGAVLAVDLAIKTLIGAVSYVMDPANNRVKYYVKPDAQDPNAPDVKYFLVVVSAADFPDLLGKKITTTDNSLCASLSKKTNNASSTFTTSTLTRDSGNGQYYCKAVMESGSISYVVSFDMYANPNYDPDAPPQEQEKYLPYDAVASQIMSDAMSDKAEGKAFVSSVADTALEDEERQIVPATDITQQLNQSQAIPTSGTGTGSIAPPTTIDPTTGEPVTPKPSDLTINFPEFCGWAPVVCQAAQTAINFPGTVAEYWNKTDKWMNQQATDTSDPKPEIKDLQLNFDDGNRVTFDQTCPQPQPIELTFMGVSQRASFSYEPLCNFMTMIRPFVIGSAYLIGAYIVMGLSRGNSE